MTLPTQYDDKNIIAMIIRGDIPNHTVYEDDEILAFMDIMPQANGHLLIVTKRPSISLLDADPDNLAHIIKKAQIIANTLKDYFKADGILLRQHTGEAAGQTIFHLHFHLIPMMDGKNLKSHGLELEQQLANRNVTLSLTDGANKWLAERGFDRSNGARPLARVIQEYIKKPLADELLFGKLKTGGKVRISLSAGNKDKKLVFSIEANVKSLPAPKIRKLTKV